MPVGLINLESDYAFNLQYDEAFVFGISIQPVMNTVINGNGHIIDGDYKAALFNILNAQFRVTFNNLTFINVGYSNDMEDCYRNQAPPGTGDARKIINAVRIVGSDVMFSNCKFISNKCTMDGAISASSFSKFEVFNSQFLSNNAANGAAITMDHSCSVEIYQSDFAQNMA